MKLTDRLIYICFLINALQTIMFIALFVGIIPAAIFFPDFTDDLFLAFQNKTFSWIYTILTLCSSINWVYCLRFWYKYDRYSKAIFPLLFPHILYAPFYYYQVKIKKRPLKGNIIEKQPEIKEDLSINDSEFVELTRQNLLGVLQLWSSKKEQLEYQKLVPTAEVTSDLFEQWNDFFTPDAEVMKEAFSADELELLASFSEVLFEIENKLKGNLPDIDKFTETKDWVRLNSLSISLLTAMS